MRNTDQDSDLGRIFFACINRLRSCLAAAYGSSALSAGRLPDNRIRLEDRPGKPEVLRRNRLFQLTSSERPIHGFAEYVPQASGLFIAEAIQSSLEAQDLTV